MKRIYLSMMKRVEYPKRVGYGDNGRVIVLDWETKQEVLPQTKIHDLRKPDNPMSRSHGSRGICFHQGKLYVGGSHQLVSILDPETNQLEETILTPAKRIHQLKEHDGVVYIISAGDDSFVKLVGTEVQEQVFMTNAGEDTLHFNSIDWHPETGDQYHTYYTPGTIVNYTTGETALDNVIGMHDIRFVDADTFVVNDSMNRTSIRVRSGERKIIYQASAAPPENVEFKGDNAPGNHALWGFTRVAVSAGNSLFVSSAPGRLVEIDTNTWEQVDVFDTTLDPGDSLYDIVLHPDDWK